MFASNSDASVVLEAAKRAAKRSAESRHPNLGKLAILCLSLLFVQCNLSDDEGTMAGSDETGGTRGKGTAIDATGPAYPVTWCPDWTSC